MSKIVERTLDFVELFAEERRPLSLSDISRLLKIPVSSCHDVLQSLLARGYLYEIAPRAGYYPTLRLFETADTIRSYDPVAARADKVLRGLRDEVDEGVLFSKVHGSSASYMLIFNPSHHLRYGARPGDAVKNMHATSAGKAALGSMGAEALEAALEAMTLTPLTGKTITSKEALRRDLQLSNERGWFLNKEESLEGITSVSAWFDWSDSAYVITIGTTTPRLAEKQDQVVAAMLETCSTLEMRTKAVPTRSAA